MAYPTLALIVCPAVGLCSHGIASPRPVRRRVAACPCGATRLVAACTAAARVVDEASIGVPHYYTFAHFSYVFGKSPSFPLIDEFSCPLYESMVSVMSKLVKGQTAIVLLWFCWFLGDPAPCASARPPCRLSPRALALHRDNRQYEALAGGYINYVGDYGRRCCRFPEFDFCLFHKIGPKGCGRHRIRSTPLPNIGGEGEGAVASHPEPRNRRSGAG